VYYGIRVYQNLSIEQNNLQPVLQDLAFSLLYPNIHPSPSTFLFIYAAHTNLEYNLSIFRLDEIRKALWFAFKVVDSITVMCVVVTMSVAVILWAYIFHLVDAATFGTAFDRAVAGCLSDIN
jgi:hypothetical protein